MGVQTSVAFDFNKAIVGGVQGDVRATNVRITTAAIVAGLFMCPDAAAGSCKLPTSAAEVGKGLGVAPSAVTNDPNFPPGGTAGKTYQIGDAIELVAQGKVWVTVEVNVADSDDVFVRYSANGGLTQLGAFRNDNDGGTHAAQIAAKFRSAANAGELALVEFNLP
jgi:hypothetical protein